MSTHEDGFSTQLGLTRVEWRDGLAQVALDLAPRHLNRNGILHGGVLLTCWTRLARSAASGAAWRGIAARR
ncbi:MAG: hypothetical protein WDN49_21040 [Acetobacteraceae bacterium]